MNNILVLSETIVSKCFLYYLRLNRVSIYIWYNIHNAIVISFGNNNHKGLPEELNFQNLLLVVLSFDKTTHSSLCNALNLQTLLPVVHIF